MATPTTKKEVAIGDLPPDFALKDQNGATVRLSDFRAKRNVIVYFYPADYSPGCTTEACAFRDSFESFNNADAEVIGISSDSVDSHKGFTTKHNLPFTLLSDDSNGVAKAWGVPMPLGFLRGRTTYIIDKAGVVRHVFNDLLNGAKHVGVALEILKTI